MTVKLAEKNDTTMHKWINYGKNWKAYQSYQDSTLVILGQGRPQKRALLVSTQTRSPFPRATVYIIIELTRPMHREIPI